MEIKNLNIKDIIPYENNPRKNDYAVDKVSKSIELFGFKVPLVIDKNNVVVCGHTRLKAAEKLNMDTLPCLIADDLTDEQINAYRLIDNKSAEFSHWDFDKLDEELKALSGFDFSDFELELPKDNEDDEDEDDSVTVKKTKTCICPECGHEFELKDGSND